MAQFDVYLNPSAKSRKHYPYLLDIQNPYISDITTRIVIPLGNVASFENEAMEILTPRINYDGKNLLLLTPQISSVPAKILKKPIGSLAHCRDQIINALDFAVTGV